MKHLLILLLCVISLSAKEKFPKADISFNEQDYSVEFTLEVDLPDSLILATLFDYNHLIQYGKKTSLKLTHLHSSDSLDQVKYSYNYLITGMSVIMNRYYHREKQEVTFRLYKFHRDNGLVPKVMTVYGGYKLDYKKGKRIVRYNQTTRFAKKISGLSKRLIKGETKKFIKEYVKYTRTVKATL